MQSLNQAMSTRSLFIIASIFALLAGYLIFCWLIQIIKELKTSRVFLEIKPTSNTLKSSLSTNQLFVALHSLGKQTSLFDKIFKVKQHISCELVSTKQNGIRYILRIPSQDASIIKKTLLAYLSGIEINEISEYLPIHLGGQIREIRLLKSFVYPLQEHSTLQQYDPIAYITAHMTKLDEDEIVALQFICSPIQPNTDNVVTKHINNLNNLMLNNFDISQNIKFGNHSTIVQVCLDILTLTLNFFIFVVLTPLTLMTWLLSNNSDERMLPLWLFNKSNNSALKYLSKNKENLNEAISNKISQPLFSVTIRYCICSKQKNSTTNRTKGIYTAFETFNSAYQTFRLHRPFISSVMYWQFKKRISFFKSPPILSISEISSLYHLPFTDTTKTEDLSLLKSPQLPAPLSLKQTNGFDVVFAKNTYGGSTTMIGLTEEERKRHVYIIGATGSGKTTMLLSMIEQDLKHGKGICVVDPHGDLSETILDCIPTERVNDLIYFNPYDIKYPIGVNLLELTPGLDEDEILIEKEFIAESVISLFRKMFSDGGSGHPHRIEYILRNTIHTAFTVENATLFTIFELLNNPAFQKKVVQKLKDENLQNFWKYEFGKAGDYQQVKMTAPVTSRIGRFLFSPSAKRILEQEKSTINFDQILDTKKILICNLSKGNIGEDTSEVMGIMILNKIQLSALKRSRREHKDRTPFYLYVDEFQNFATPSFVQMLSESRKYGLNLTIAEQSTSQQNDRNLTHVILANVGTVVGFRSANPIDEDLLLRQFSPRVEKGDIANLPAYRFYMKTSALRPEDAFSGVTIPLNLNKSLEYRSKIMSISRERYAKLYIKKLNSKIIEEQNRNQEHKNKHLPSHTESFFPEG